jgi:hypothetical protein
MSRVHELGETEIQRLMLAMPFEKFERRRYLKYDRDLADIRFDGVLWRQLTPEALQEIRTICQRSIQAYHERFQSE